MALVQTNGERGKFSLARMRRVADERLAQLVEHLFLRAERRVKRLVKRSQNAKPRDLSRRAIARSKKRAATLGGTTGMLGLAAFPVDVIGMLYLELELLVEIAAIYGADLRTEGARAEVMDLFSVANGLGLLGRPGTLALGKAVTTLLSRGGFHRLSRAVPLVSAPISAALNNRHVQSVGDAAVRHYEGWRSAHEKAERFSSK